MSNRSNNSPRNLPANNPPAPETDEKPAMTEMEQLKALLAKFGKADIAKLVKEVTENKQTVLSVTMDCIVSAGNTLIANTVTKAVTTAGRAAGVLGEKDEASVTSVAQLIRHVQAYRAAVKRHENKELDETTSEETSEENSELDVSKLNAGEPAYQEQPAS